MKFVSPILKRCVYPALSRARYFSSTSPSGLAVITYHGVLPAGYRPIDETFDGSLITAEMFRRQLRLLKRDYSIITPAEMRAWCQDGCSLPRRAVLLTCDDGLLSNLTEMLPILQEESLQCLFFVTGASTGIHRTMLWYEDLLLMFLRARGGHFSVASGDVEITGFLGNKNERRSLWWQSVLRLSRISSHRRQDFLAAIRSHFELEDSMQFYRPSYPAADRHFFLMNGNELKTLSAAGMSIGAHTLTHPMLSQMPQEMAWVEMAESRRQLEMLLGKSVWAFAYPFGQPESVNPEIIATAKEIGFEAAFMNVGGGLGSAIPKFAIPRVHVSAGMGLAEFEAHVSGFYERVRHGFRRRPQFPSKAVSPYATIVQPSGLSRSA